MFKNYWKLAFRTLVRNRVYTMINVAGLALGICSCLAIWLITRYEFSFDRFQPERERIFRLMTLFQVTKDDHIQNIPNINPAFPQVIRSSVTGLESVAPYHIMDQTHASVTKEGRLVHSYPATPIITVPDYLSIMPHIWLCGNPKTALSKPFSVVLTESRARTYFGAGSWESMLGRELIYNDSLRVLVSGVVGDWKENSDFPYEEFISLSTADHSFLGAALQLTQKGFPPSSSRLLLKLQAGASQEKVGAAISKLFEDNGKGLIFPGIVLQPLGMVHFTDSASQTDIRTAHLPTLNALLVIALFILLLAMINYINLSTAHSIGRDKEVGIRKVLGSSRGHLMLQFLCETFLLCLMATVIALLAIRPVLGAFREFLPPAVIFDPRDAGTWLFLLGLVILTTLLSGLYPARMLSSFLPAVSLKGSGAPRNSEKWWLRKALIVFQFTISLLFIIGTLVIGKQINYMRTKDLGFRSDAIILLNRLNGDSLNSVKVLADKIRNLPDVEAVSRGNMPPMGTDKGVFSIRYYPRSDENIIVNAIEADDHYLDLYGIKLLAGRNIYPSDTIKEILINETLAHQLGFERPEQAIGQLIHTWNMDCPIVGVVADFHQTSFHDVIQPQLIAGIASTDIAVRLKAKGRSGSEVRHMIDKIRKQWQTMFPHEPFEFEFFDESLAQLYKKEQVTAWMARIATAITIFISCMGLFGLSLFTAEKRTREIGIRKVLGASIGDIAFMLSGDFLRLVVVALLLASPIAWYAMQRWLQDFAYRVSIDLWIFVLAGITAVGIALFTISFQALRAARANPVKSLRTE